MKTIIEDVCANFFHFWALIILFPHRSQSIGEAFWLVPLPPPVHCGIRMAFLKHYFVQTVSACVQLPSMLLQIIIFSASLVAQAVKNLPAVQETQVGSLGREDPLEKGMATHSSILAWRIPWTEDPVSPRIPKKSDTTERLTLCHHTAPLLFPPKQAFCSHLVYMCNALCTTLLQESFLSFPLLSTFLVTSDFLVFCMAVTLDCHSHTCRHVCHPLHRNLNSLRSEIACASLKHSSHPWYSTSYMLRWMSIFT